MNSPPTHLRPATKKFWAEVVENFELETQHLYILALLCDALDRAAAAREIIDEEGAIFKNRFAEPRQHPAVAIERNAQITAARLLRE